MLKIKINKWRDYLIRTDLHAVTWIRVPVVLPITRALHGLVSDTRWLLVYFLCEAGRENAKGELNIELDYVAAFSGCSTKQIFDGLKSLQDRGFLTVEYEGNTEATRLQHERNTTPCTDNTTPCNENTETYGFVSKKREEERREEKRREEYNSWQTGDPGYPQPPPAKAKRPKGRSGVQVMDLSDPELSLGTQWLQYAVHHYPTKVDDPKWTPAAFALELRKVANTIGLSIEQMSELCTWIASDTFWCDKAASPYGLLKKGTNGMRKIENAMAATKSRAQIKNEQRAAQWERSPEEREAYERGMALFMEGLKK